MRSTPVLEISGRRVLQGKTPQRGDCGGLRGTVGDCGGLWGIVGDCGGRPGTAGDCGLLPVTTGNHESYQQDFMTPVWSKYRNSSNKIKRNLRLSSRDK